MNMDLFDVGLEVKKKISIVVSPQLNHFIGFMSIM